jgi:membrane protein
VTFYALLAIFPAIAALVSLYGLVADPATMSSQLNAMSTVLPGGAIDILSDQLKRLTSHPSGALGIGFVVGLVIALWTANSGVKAMFEALNIVYNETEKRSFIKLNLVSLTFTLGAILLTILALVAIAVVPVALKFVGLGAITETLISILRWPLLLVIVAVAIALVYRYGPSRRKAKWRWISWGSAFASVAWLAVSILFSWYVSNFGSYDKTYGSLGAAIGFMTWIWLSTIVVLVGAELDSEMEHQTAEDTTEGPRKPLGTRDATMADSVGAAKTA